MIIMNKKKNPKTKLPKIWFSQVAFECTFLEDTGFGIWPRTAFIGRGSTWEDSDSIYIKIVSHWTSLNSGPPTFFFLFLSTNSAGENAHSVINSCCAHMHIWSHSIHKNSMWSFPGINVPLRRLLWKRDCKQHDVQCDKCSNIWNAAISSSTLVLFSVSGRVSGWGWTSSDF